MYKDDGFYDEGYDILEKDRPLEDIVKDLFIEVKEVSQYIAYLHDLIPMKYKKLHPKEGENPFFFKADLKYTPEEGQAARKRLEELLRQHPQE